MTTQRRRTRWLEVSVVTSPLASGQTGVAIDTGLPVEQTGITILRSLLSFDCLPSVLGSYARLSVGYAMMSGDAFTAAFM